MPIKAKYNGSYKDITDLMNVDESIDYVLAKTSSSYKRVYTATRSIEDAPPTTFKSIKPGANLTDYRIYGNTSKNILPLSKTPKTETIGDILCEYDGKGTFTFTSNVDNPTYTQDQWFWVPFEEDFDFPVGISDGGHGCIQLNNDFATGYGVTPYFVGFANRDNGEFVSGFNVAGSALNIVDTNYYTEDLEGLPANCIAFQYLQQIGKRTVTIKPALYLDIRTQQPFEPYGESVGDRTANLFDCDNTKDTEVNGIVWSCKNQIITANGATGNLSSSTFGHKRITGLYGSFILACVSDTNNDCICVVSVQETQSSTRTYNISTTNSYATFSLTGEEYEVIVYAQVNKNKEVNNAQFFISLTEGSTPPDTYEPYGYKVPVTVEGKNLLQNTGTSQTVNGVEFTINANGSVTCNEQATSAIYFKINSRFTLPVGEFVLTGCPTGGGNSSYRMYIQSHNLSPQKYYTDTGNGVTIDNTNADTVYSARISIVSGYSCNNLTFYPMIRKADIEDDTYEPYHAPITTPIYLPEQIRKVGDEAEYIDYEEQKQHRVRKNLLDDKQTLNASIGSLSTEPLIYGFPGVIGGNRKTYFLPVTPGEQYTISMTTTGDRLTICGYYNIVNPNEYTTENRLPSDVVILPQMSENIPSAYTFIVPNNVVMVSIYFSLDIQPNQFQIEKGSTATTYEPYIENTDLDVILPALPTVTGTNTLSVGTAVQPSKIDITGHIKTISGGS